MEEDGKREERLCLLQVGGTQGDLDRLELFSPERLVGALECISPMCYRVPVEKERMSYLNPLRAVHLVFLLDLEQLGSKNKASSVSEKPTNKKRKWSISFRTCFLSGCFPTQKHDAADATCFGPMSAPLQNTNPDLASSIAAVHGRQRLEGPAFTMRSFSLSPSASSPSPSPSPSPPSPTIAVAKNCGEKNLIQVKSTFQFPYQARLRVLPRLPRPSLLRRLPASDIQYCFCSLPVQYNTMRNRILRRM